MSYFKMSKLVLKWALSKPSTSKYPFEPRQAIPLSRGNLSFEKATCVYCTVCAKKCPTGALGVHRAEKKWTIDRLRCISCGACIEACPKKSLSFTTDHGIPAITKDRELH
jgi:ech hydrogenase subunit F